MKSRIKIQKLFQMLILFRFEYKNQEMNCTSGPQWTLGMNLHSNIIILKVLGLPPSDSNLWNAINGSMLSCVLSLRVFRRRIPAHFFNENEV